MASYPTSHLSLENVMRDVHDPVKQRLRVNVETDLTPGQVEVAINHEDDSIRLGDGTNFLTSTTQGGKVGLDVNVISSNATTVKTQFAEVIGVATGVVMTVVSYTAVSGDFLQKVDVAGTNIAGYTLRINGVATDKRYTYFQNLNEHFSFEPGLALTAGDVVLVEVVHNRPVVGNFNGRIQVGAT